LVWKSDISFGDKALGLKKPAADVIHYCQLGKLAVERHINDLDFSCQNDTCEKSANFKGLGFGNP